MPASGMGNETSCFSNWRALGLSLAVMLTSSSSSASKFCGFAVKVSSERDQ